MASINTLLLKNRTQESLWVNLGVYSLPETKTEKDREAVIAKVKEAVNVKNTETASEINAKAISLRAAVGTTGEVAFSAFWLSKPGDHPEWNAKKTFKEAMKMKATDLLAFRQQRKQNRTTAIDNLDF